MLALLIGILIGEKYRKWKKAREEKNNITGAGIRRTEGENPGKKDAGTDTRKKRRELRPSASVLSFFSLFYVFIKSFYAETPLSGASCPKHFFGKIIPRRTL